MARTLPWLTNSPAGRAQAVRASPSKRQKLLHDASTSHPNSKTEPRAAATARRSRLTGGATRTPSTSPPPQPPSQHDMRPGLHADDIYIMVEDEFLATAQLYTAHLHHAEYHRLKALSDSRMGQSMDISRPITDATMRNETRRSKEAERQAKGIEEGIDSILPKPRPAEEANEESDFEVEQDDPWQGTHLQRFMNVNPRKERGLIGLQGMTSRTRAAAGFAAPERSPFGTPSKLQSSPNPPPEETKAEESDDEDDDNLDAHYTRTSSLAPIKPAVTDIRRGETSPTPQRNKGTPHEPLGKSILQRRSQDKVKPQKPNIPKRSFLDMTPLPGSPTKAPPSPPSRSKIKEEAPENDSEPMPQYPHSSALPSKKNPVLQRLKKKREEERQRKRELLDDGVTGLDKIPVFLV